MRFLLKRPTIALLLALLWIGWALWANVPHYYDAQAMKTEIAAVLGSENGNLQPAAAGFPFTYMRCDFSNSDQLTIHDTELSALLPNALFSLAGALGIALLVARTRHISFLGIALSCCLLFPAALMHSAPMTMISCIGGSWTEDDARARPDIGSRLTTQKSPTARSYFTPQTKCCGGFTVRVIRSSAVPK